MDEAMLKFMRETDEELKSISRKAFKNADFSSWGNSGMDFSAKLSRSNKDFGVTEYYYKGDLTFFHLTSVPLLTSILNERAVRFYDLNSSADPDEYTYAGTKMKLHPRLVESRKSNLFTFSFCPFSEIQNDHVWDIYGRKYQGVAIVFEVVNDPGTWVNFHMSEIKYEVPAAFEQFGVDMEEVQRRRGISVDYDLSKLIGFHKKPAWNGEKEVRILTYYPFDSYEEFLRYAKTEFRLQSQRNRMTHYFKLPFWVDNDSGYTKSHTSSDLHRDQNLPKDFFDTRPKLKIKDILFGEQCGITTNEFPRFKRELEDLILFNYGYKVTISSKFVTHPKT